MRNRATSARIGTPGSTVDPVTTYVRLIPEPMTLAEWHRAADSGRFGPITAADRGQCTAPDDDADDALIEPIEATTTRDT